MAVSTSSFFNNAIVGTPQVGFDTNVHETHTSAKFAIGTKFERQDGSVFRYVHFGAAVDAGVLVAQDLSESSTIELANSIIAPANALAVPNETISAGKIGSRFVEISPSGTATADQYSGGYMCLTSDTAKGYIHRIRGNTADGNPTTNHIRLELYKALVTAVDATTDASLVGSRYANLEIAVAATDNHLAGVTLRVQGAAAYGWVQSRGTAVILGDNTGSDMAVGDILALSDSVSGAVHQAGGGGESANIDLVSEQIVGYCVVVSAAASDTASAVVQMNLE